MKQKLLQDFELLKKQLFWIELSYNESIQIGIKETYTIEEFGKFETLCSRYSRGIDFLIRKIFRTIDAYEFENQGTLVDVFDEVLEYTQKLIKIIDTTLIYIENRIK